MRVIQFSTTRILIGGALALFASVLIANAQLPPVKPGPTPNEANFFIATPPGWVQPKTPWGDPDLQGIWPISYVGTVIVAALRRRFRTAAGQRPALRSAQGFSDSRRNLTLSRRGRPSA